jgi:hypothetical protein
VVASDFSEGGNSETLKQMSRRGDYSTIQTYGSTVIDLVDRADLPAFLFMTLQYLSDPYSSKMLNIKTYDKQVAFKTRNRLFTRVDAILDTETVGVVTRTPDKVSAYDFPVFLYLLSLLRRILRDQSHPFLVDHVHRRLQHATAVVSNNFLTPTPHTTTYRYQRTSSLALLHGSTLALNCCT